MLFSERLKLIRAERGLTQKAVADSAGMTLQSYQRYEYGTREPEYKYFLALAESLDVSLDYLSGRIDNPNSHKCNF